MTVLSFHTSSSSSSPSYSFSNKKISKNSAFLRASLIFGDFTITSFNNEEKEAKPASFASPSIQLVDIGSGWGDGAHPTTQLCIDFLLLSLKEGNIVLDYGCGSGILSILAAKKGASKCYAIDIDEDSLHAARRNSALNGVEERIEVLHTARICPGDDSIPFVILEITCFYIALFKYREIWFKRGYLGGYNDSEYTSRSVNPLSGRPLDVHQTRR